jgi:hypothetical protein
MPTAVKNRAAKTHHLLSSTLSIIAAGCADMAMVGMKPTVQRLHAW